MRISGTFLFAVLLIGIAGLLSACASEPPAVAPVDLPEGDAGSGEKLFVQSINDAPTCASCHNLSSASNDGPGLEGIGQVAAERVAGQNAREYLYMSIVRPSSHVVRGYSNVMYSEYEDKLSTEDIADLIAYLLML